MTIFIAETGKARILKHYLAGDNAGLTQIFAEGLPGLPDNLYLSDSNTLWAGLVSKRDWRLDALAPFPNLRRLLGLIPVSLLAPKFHYGFIIGLNEDGSVRYNLQTDDAYTQITTGIEVDSDLYLGSLGMDSIGYIRLP